MLLLSSLSMEMSRLTRDGTAEPVSRGQILRHARGKGNIHFPCSTDHEQDWQPDPVDPYSAICDDHTYIHTYCRCSKIFRTKSTTGGVVSDGDDVIRASCEFRAFKGTRKSGDDAVSKMSPGLSPWHPVRGIDCRLGKNEVGPTFFRAFGKSTSESTPSCPNQVGEDIALSPWGQRISKVHETRMVCCYGRTGLSPGRVGGCCVALGNERHSMIRAPLIGHRTCRRRQWIPFDRKFLGK